MKKIFIVLGVVLGIYACGENQKSDKQATSEDSVENQEVIVAPDPIEADSASVNYDYEIVVPDLENPWGFTFLPDQSMLITEKKGELIHFKNEEKQIINGLPEVYYHGQGGLLDVALHPDYENNGWIYITYASPEGEGEGGNTALIRAKLNNNQLTDVETLYKATPNTTKGQHFGSRIVFDNDGYLYFTIGDRGETYENPQDLTRDGGKVYRLNDDGSIPDDNPFVGEENAKEAIYSYGHRNQQGMILHPGTGELWAHEHGPQGGDELNIVKEGENYGWAAYTYGIDYDDSVISEETSGEKIIEPIHYWNPSIAPSGMAYVTSDKYPHLQDNLLVGSLKFQYLEHLVLDGKKVQKREKLLEGIGRVRDVRQGPNGSVYLAVENLGIVELLPGKEEQQ